MKYFACPSGPSCGPLYLTATNTSQTYSLHSGALDQKRNYCNHQISFSIDGGSKDILMIRFIDYEPETRVSFSVGRSPETATGEMIDNLDNKLLKVSFPNKLFLSVEHSVESIGPFSFEFWYKDQEVIGAAEEVKGEGYSLITEQISTNGKYYFSL